MAIVGYFEGTDPTTLTRLTVRGIETLPLSNGYDSHGRLVGHVTRDQVHVIIGYLHKALPAAGTNLSSKDILYNCQVHMIPVILVAERSDHERARAVLADMGSYVTLTTAEELFDTVLSKIS